MISRVMLMEVIKNRLMKKINLWIMKTLKMVRMMKTVIIWPMKVRKWNRKKLSMNKLTQLWWHQWFRPLLTPIWKLLRIKKSNKLSKRMLTIINRMEKLSRTNPKNKKKEKLKLKLNSSNHKRKKKIRLWKLLKVVLIRLCHRLEN